MIPYNKSLVGNAKSLRKNMTPEEKRLDDEKRDADLSLWGIRVLRYPNEAINKNFTAVCGDILDKLGLTFEDLKPIKSED